MAVPAELNYYKKWEQDNPINPLVSTFYGAG